MDPNSKAPKKNTSHGNEVLPQILHISYKAISQGTVKGGRRQGRQRKRWEENIRKWTGLEFAKSQRAVENKGNCTRLVVNLSVMPQRPSRLRG